MNRSTLVSLLAVAGIVLAVGGYRLGLSDGQGAPSKAAAEPASGASTARKVLYWHDPMVPGQRFDRPGKSPFMDMQLVPVYADETVLLFARQTPSGEVALEAISRLAAPATVTAALPPSLGLQDGATLHDRMGGADAQVSGGTVTITLGPQGVAILAP